MQSFIKKNINRDHIFTALNQLSKSVNGFAALLLVPIFISPEEQGYWFTFSSLAALVMLADLGFSNLILQFSAHEFVHLHFDSDRTIKGDERHLKRLSTLFTFTSRWITTIVLLSVPVILFIGYYLFSLRRTEVHWFIPWIVFVIAAAMSFVNNVILYFFEGCDSVGIVQRMRSVIAIFMTLTMSAALALKLGLLALSVSLLASAVLGSILIWREFGPAISGFIEESKTYSHQWGGEVVPLFWRYAISWASGYFIFQMYTPVMFHFHGPVEAGKIGISITLWMGIFSISNVWVSAVTPKLNMLVSKKDWKALDTLFLKSLLFSIATFMTGVVFVFLLFLIFRGKVTLFERFIGNLSMSILAAGWFFQISINTLAVYLRAHKEEPLAMPSFVSAVYIVLTTFLCAKFLPPEYFFLGFLSSYLWGLPWILTIFYRRRKGHSNDQPAIYKVAYDSNSNL